MHTLIDFKSFEKAEVDLFQPLTVLIGPNGSGKTNLIEGVELLAHLASGKALHTVSDVGRSGDLEVRGGLQGCARRPGKPFRLEWLASVPFEGQPQTSRYSVAVSTDPSPQIIDERLEVGDRVLFHAVRHEGPATPLAVTYDNFNRGGKKPIARVATASSILSQYEIHATANQKLESCTRTVEIVRHHLARAYVFDPNPRVMRGYDRIGNNVLGRDGANLSSVLHSLQATQRSPATLDRILGLIQQIPEESFAGFGFESTKLGDVIFGMKRAGSQDLIDARLLSDGTLRALAVLTALEVVPEGSRIIVEEVDNGLHPSRVGVLTAALSEAAQRRKLNVLVTTHNPATLDTLSPAQLDGVLVCHRASEGAATTVTRLRSLPDADHLLERGKLGDLVTRRIADAYLAPESDAERMVRVARLVAALP